MGENSSERAERRVWTPEVVDEQTAIVRALGPGYEAAATALASMLLKIAEQALHDRPAAERIVTAILRDQSQLVTTATRAVTPSQREAAQEALTRAVRRAVLDALPPVVQAPSLTRTSTDSPSKSAGTRNLRPLVVKNTTDFPAAAKLGGKRHGPFMVIGCLALLLGAAAAWFLLFGLASDRSAEQPEVAPVVPQAMEDPLPDPLRLQAVEPAGEPLLAVPPATPAEPVFAEATSELPVSAGSSAEVVSNGSSVAVAAVPRTPSLGLAPGNGTLRLFIHYPEGDSAASEAAALYAAVSQTGEVPLVVLRDVDFEISAPRIRYFYAADADAVRTLADFLDAPGSSWQIQDFSYVRPLPATGTVEIYVPGP